ncbi:calcium-translocating P-type ATPase [Colletotrichum karsti]|uniref:Calcium-transporting ATPase n=1 Tax=Colletotrichum karsti TaxID=1095194 RepID=A0A9P6I4H2_9PEZI|nr:calcium-translocating P-type ATPase [Colletotrichum karsti]KAF9876049.1 calcium-translocating P-type ATPase [Colletotrichum karsti]
MHILLTNDDGPPSPHSSPYVHSLVHYLQKAGHVVSVCLPHTQRSWIGKAHMIGQTVKPLYYRPSPDGLHGTEGTTSTRPSAAAGEEEWVLVDGTPASCVQIALHHFFKERGPIDLVVSGPNYGRNTTAVFALSSGTLGGALEAAVCKRKSIALSYAFFSRNHDPVIIEGAARHSVRVIEKLYQQWPAGDEVDLYTVNVPLVEGVETHKTMFTGVLQNYWRQGSCFQEIEGDVGDEDEEEEKIREGDFGEALGGDEEPAEKKESGEKASASRTRHFKWAPKFTDVYQSVEEAPPGNDGWAVKEGYTSVTPLKANFWHPSEHLHKTELILDGPGEKDKQQVELPVRTTSSKSSSKPGFHAIINYEDPYVQPLILEAMNRLFPGKFTLLPPPQPNTTTDDAPALAAALPAPDARVLHIAPYESLDFDHVGEHPSTTLVNSYIIRKALIRKHYLSATVDHWVAKHPDSALKTHVQRGEHFEVDYAEFLDDALVEAFDLRESMDRNEAVENAKDREWWILKPGMSDRGQGIRLFSTMEELQGVFDEWEEERPDSDDEDDDENENDGQQGVTTGGGDYITTSHLRHFVVQPYIHPPLLLPGDARKFHIRTYVLCVGSLDVYVYKPMLALFAGKAYKAPWEDADLDAHLTNTCLQGGGESALPPVKQFWDLVGNAQEGAGGLSRDAADGIFARICEVTGDIFEAAAREMTIHFQPLGNAFEVFGLDFLVDEEARPWLLEVNSFPDFKQTGGDLKDVVAGFWEETLRRSVGGFFGVDAEEGERKGEMVHVRKVELGRRPTITIDTSEAGVAPNPAPEMAQDTQRDASSSPISPKDEAVSPTTVPKGANAPWAAPSEKPMKPKLRADTSFDASDSRPQSPHNVSSPVETIRGNNRAFLAVPSNLRSRQNSIDSNDEISSQGETIAVLSQSTEKTMKNHSPVSNDKIMKDDNALAPDKGSEDDFKAENNPFAFTPGQLNKLFNPKSLSAYYALGGLIGIEKGLRSDRKAGLSQDEVHLDGYVSFSDATGHLSASGDFKEAKSEPTAGHSGHHDKHADDGFVDRKRVFKDNRIPEKKGKTLLELMWITYQDKVLILLTAAAIVSLAIGIYQTVGLPHAPGEPKVEWVEGVAIVVAIAIVVIVGSLNDYSKERQFAKLNQKKKDRDIKVVRSGRTVEISVHNLLAGDVVHLEPGDLVPVDGILIEGFNVKCDESQATGESDIIKKRNGDDVFNAIQNGEDPKKLDPFIQSGARIMEGVGTFMVTSTGIHSSYGKTLMALDEDPEVTPLQSKLNTIAEYIAKLGGAAGLLLFIVLFIEFLVKLPKQPASVTPAEKGQLFINIVITVVTIIVVAVPEGLPLAVTLALSFATRRMLKDMNLVRHLKACEVMGNANTICSDKTGTLTQNKMQVVAGTVGTSHRFGGSRSSEDDDGAVGDSSDISIAEFSKMLSAPVKDILLKSIALNSTAFEGEVDGEKTYVGSKTESALLLLARDYLGMGPVAEERENAKILQLIPFDSGRKCMGIIVQLPNGGARLYVKGASEIVLAKCTQLFRDPSQDATLIQMTEPNFQTVNTLINAYASRSLRTIGIAYRDFEQWPPRHARRVDGDKTEIEFEDLFRTMNFVGMVGIQDPLREGVPEAVRLCQKAGVFVRMVTGDNKLTAEAIAKECGILQPNGIVMEGPEFRNLTKAEQEAIIPRLCVLARSSPEDKRVLVKRLKAKGDIVAVTGDGTNDAPALKTADVGFSMGIAGTEVAKEASSIILMDDNFNSIVKALKWGRSVNDAVKRFLQFQLTVNITAVILTFVTAVSSTSVLTAVQLLWVNLIMDTLAALALATDPPQDSVLDRKPERRNASIITTTMWKMILGQAVYQLAITFMCFYGKESIVPGPEHIPDEQIATMVFNTFVWMQIFNQWNNRRLDNHFNIFEGLTKNYFFIAISTIMIGGQVLIVFFGGAAFQIADEGQSAIQWAMAVILGAISIPFGVVIRLIPDSFVEGLVPEYLKRRAKDTVPGLTVSDEEQFEMYPAPLSDVRDELAFIKRMKGGRLNNLKFAVQHPRETFARSRSPSHSRSNSIKAPSTPTREDSFGSLAQTPDSRKRSRSSRSRSNSALGAPTVMAGIVAAGIAANWSPADRRPRRESDEDDNVRRGVSRENSIREEREEPTNEKAGDEKNGAE